MKQKVLFVLSIDTEEEWDWNASFPREKTQVENIKFLPGFHDICNALGVKPTYFVDYAVVDSPSAVSHMQQIIEKGSCEIGAHLHPWCNPPYNEEISEKNSHVVNLPIGQVEKKLDVLIDKLNTELGSRPVSFRTGRWGIDSKVMQLLLAKGFNLDSSVYPFYENEFFSCLGWPSRPYWPDLNNPKQTHSQRDIFELPVTVGFNRTNFTLWNTIHKAFAKPPLSWTRFNGIAWHSHLMRKSYLCPEYTAAEDMLNLCDKVIQKGSPVLHMYMHSSSLIDNSNSLLGNQNAFNYISDTVKQVISQLKVKYELEFCTISEAKQKLTKESSDDII